MLFIKHLASGIMSTKRLRRPTSVSRSSLVTLPAFRILVIYAIRGMNFGRGSFTNSALVS